MLRVEQQPHPGRVTGAKGLVGRVIRGVTVDLEDVMDEQVEDRYEPPSDGGNQVSPDAPNQQLKEPPDEAIEAELTSRKRKFGVAWLGFLLQTFAGNNFLGLGGTILAVFGLSEYAKMKGRHRAWGLVGLLSLIGLLILYLLPPICRRCGTKNSYSNERCSECQAPVAPQE